MVQISGILGERRQDKCTLPGTPQSSWPGAAHNGQGLTWCSSYSVLAFPLLEWTSCVDTRSFSIVWGGVPPMRFRYCPDFWQGMCSQSLARTFNTSLKNLGWALGQPPSVDWELLLWLGNMFRFCFRTVGGHPTSDLFWDKEEKHTLMLLMMKKQDLPSLLTA